MTRPGNAEIARLKARIAELEGMQSEVLHYQREFHRLKDERDAALARVGRLEKALIQISETEWVDAALNPQRLRAIAAAALNDKET